MVVESASLNGTGPELFREAERVADRLRVLGPRWAARRRDPDVTAVAMVRAALQSLADLAAEVDAAPHRQVPELALHALADQVLVLAYEAHRAGAAGPAADVLTGLRRNL
jgi:hypothetical protein